MPNPTGIGGRMSREDARIQSLALAAGEIAAATSCYQLAKQFAPKTVVYRMHWDEGLRHEQLAARFLEPAR